MTAVEEARFVDHIRAKPAISTHWGDIIGIVGDAERSRDLARPPVEIKEPRRS
ncbi:MAG TPA: hypothetical protein P5269_08105 [Syntrophales bacterium]|nr:hypothetical protein [Syntrophales bacterium]HRS87581.1 hypothetical protein [Syntrophales bacterium]